MRSCSRSEAGVCATVRLGFACCRRASARGLEAGHVAAGRQREPAHSTQRRSPKAAGRPSHLPFRNPCHKPHCLSGRLGMVSSENRYPLFGVMP